MKRTLNRNLSALLRLGIAAAIFFSIIYQITDRVVNNVFRPFEYFSYFTIQTGLITGTVLTIAGLSALRNAEDSYRVTMLRLWVISYEVVVGIFYNVLLRDPASNPPDPRDVGYDWPVLPNEILHTWAPIILVVEWLIAGGKPAYAWKKVWWVIVYPLSWLGFSILRGMFAPDHWWAYWFLNPGENGEGVGNMVTYILLIAGTMLAFAYGFTAIRKALGRRG